nr:hypothetical protein [Bacteroidota bacterium]
MKHIIKILLIALIAPSGAMAQSWCPSGATWRFNLLFTLGYIEYYYAGDSSIDGYAAQRIHHLSVLQYPQPPPQPPSEPYYSDTALLIVTRN